MLATLVGKAFNEPGWVFEEKYNGIRVLAYKEGKLYANGSDLRQKPLSDRRKMLERVVPTDKALLLVLDSIIDDFEFNVASLIGRSGVQALFHSAMVEYHARVRSILRSTIIFSNPAR